MTVVRSAMMRLVALAIAATAIAADVRAAEQEAALLLSPGTTVTVACDTKAVVVAADAAKASNGPITLSLSGPAGAAEAGVWRITAVGDQHRAAFASAHRETCKDGCPLSVQPSGDIQIWSPKPNSIDKLAEGEVLLLAVLKPATMALRASTFRGKDIEALEEGVCRKVTP